jgi:hypothetical protein
MEQQMAETQPVEILKGIPIPEDDGSRARSTIEFPYLDLDIAVEIAKGVHQVGGSNCQWDQLAAHLNQTATGGGFRLRVMTAKTFGLVTYAQQTVSLTKLGTQICDPQQEAAAKVEAFLFVPLYNAIHEKFKGVTLPPTEALETVIAGLGVAPKQKNKARQAFQRSATQAGFFAFGPNRLVRPSIKGGAAAAAPPVEQENRREKKEKDEDQDDSKHPLIEGLIKALPAQGADWPLEARKKWLQAAAMNFDYVYADSTNDQGSVKVSIERENSAK